MSLSPGLGPAPPEAHRLPVLGISERMGYDVNHGKTGFVPRAPIGLDWHSCAQGREALDVAVAGRLAL